MDKIAIMGWGIISELGNDEEEILANWDRKKEITGGSIAFVHKLDPRKIRRMSRLAKMLTSVSENSLTMAGESGGENTGIIMNTAYGSINVNLDFGKIISEPELASPMDFANTVSNAALGHVALYFDLRGPSTLLMGSDVIAYSMRQLEKKEERAIIVCGGDEYCMPIAHYAQKKYGHSCLGEGVAAILLKRGCKSEWGSIIGEAQGGLGFFPLYEPCTDVTDPYKRVIKKVLASSGLETNEVDAVFLSSDPCSGVRTYEENAVHEIFGKEIPKELIKDRTGESFGASALSSVIAASVMIRNNRYQRVLVLGLEVSGTLEAFIISK